MKKFIFAFTLLLISSASFAAYQNQVFMRGIRPLGMGGAFVAIADDQNAVFYNPAGLTQRQGGQFTLFELPINVSDDLSNFVNFYRDNSDALKDFGNQEPGVQRDLMHEILTRVVTYRPVVRLGFPNTSFLTGNQFLTYGFGLFNQSEVSVQFSPDSLALPKINMWGNVDVMLGMPLAHRFDSVPFIPGKISAGATLKYISRARIEDMDRDILTFEDFNPQLQWGKGFGLDIGGLYQPNDRLNIGLQITDFGGTALAFEKVTASDSGQTDKAAFTGLIKPQWNAGVAYIPSRLVYWPGRSLPLNDRLLLACDVRDLMSSDERLLDATFFKKLHLGAEFRVGPLSLRGGFSSGYPTAGFGLRIPYLGLKVDYAYWGDELGRYAGQIGEFNHQINFAFSWGDSKGRAYGTAAAKAPAVTNKGSEPVKTVVPVAAEAAPATVVPASAPASTGSSAVLTSDTQPQAQPAGEPARTADPAPVKETAPAAEGSIK